MKALRHGLCWAVLLSAGLGTCGCVVNSYQAPLKPPTGALFTQIQAPLMADYDRTAVGSASGSSTSLCFHDWLLTGVSVAWDECSIETAAKAGGLREITGADYKLETILGFFGKMTVTAYGYK